jgi:hypothetical protein
MLIIMEVIGFGIRVTEKGFFFPLAILGNNIVTNSST